MLKFYNTDDILSGKLRQNLKFRFLPYLFRIFCVCVNRLFEQNLHLTSSRSFYHTGNFRRKLSGIQRTNLWIPAFAPAGMTFDDFLTKIAGFTVGKNNAEFRLHLLAFSVTDEPVEIFAQLLKVSMGLSCGIGE